MIDDNDESSTESLRQSMAKLSSHPSQGASHLTLQDPAAIAALHTIAERELALAQTDDLGSPQPTLRLDDHFRQVGERLGRLVMEKNAAYGDAFVKGGEFLRLLYPDGIKPDQYREMLGLIRIFDKMIRIATAPDAFDENPTADIGGYGILMTAIREKERTGKLPPR